MSLVQPQVSIAKLSMDMSIFDKCQVWIQISASNLFFRDRFGRFGGRCNDESVRNKLLFFRGKLEEKDKQ